MMRRGDIDDDNFSVGSLAFLESRVVSKKMKEQRSPSHHSDENSSDDGSDVGISSSTGAVRKLSRSIKRTKALLVALLVLAGIFLIMACLFIQSSFFQRECSDEEDPENFDADATDVGRKEAGIIAGIYIAQLLLFLRYDYLVARRQSTVMELAVQAKAIVDSLFPSVVRDRLMNQQLDYKDHEDEHSSTHRSTNDIEAITRKNTLANKRNGEDAKNGKTALGNFLDNGETGKGLLSQPIAEHFESATVMFTDISGFTGKLLIFMRCAFFSIETLFLTQLLSRIWLLQPQHGAPNEIRHKFSSCSKLFTQPLTRLLVC
jgi:hypothetical protein